jgi:predicted HTH domain antitoxin
MEDLCNFVKSPKHMVLMMSEEEIRKTGMTETQLKLEIAIHFFSIGAFTLGQAASFCSLNQAEMMEILGTRKIPMHYTVEDLDYDYQNIVQERDADYK